MEKYTRRTKTVAMAALFWWCEAVNLETSLQSNAAAVTLVCAWYVLAS